MAAHSSVIVMLNVMIMTLKAGYQTIFCLSHILDLVCCAGYQVYDVLGLARCFDHAAVESVSCGPPHMASRIKDIQQSIRPILAWAQYIED